MKFIALIHGKPCPVEVVEKDGHYSLTLGDKSFSVDAIHPAPQTLSLLIEGKSYDLGVEKRGHSFSVRFSNDTVDLDLFEARKYKAAELVKKPKTSGPSKVVAPMPGKIVKVSVTLNETVKEGDSLLIMEAMKMQNELKALRSGVVKEIHVKEGEPVSPSQVLMVLE